MVDLENPHLTSLTGVRFFAAFSVLISHVAYVTRVPRWVDSLHPHGRAGVSFFFILSGFILTFNYRNWFAGGVRRPALLVFARARFARIYPMYFLALLLLTPAVIHLVHAGKLFWLPPGAMTSRSMLGAWLAQLLLVQTYCPSIAWEYLWNVPGWSVACEAFFYAMFPWIMLTMNRRLRTGSALIGFAIITFIAQTAAFFVAAKIIHRTVDDKLWLEVLDWVAYKLPLFRLPEFVIGCCAGLLFLDHRPRLIANATGRNAILFLCMAAIALNLKFNSHSWQGTGFLNWYILYTPIFATMIFCLACGPTFLSAMLDHHAVATLGEASYCLYLIHWGAVLLLNTRYAPGRAPVAVSAFAIADCIGASVVLWRWFEVPARRWLRGRKEPTLFVG